MKCQNTLSKCNAGNSKRHSICPLLKNKNAQMKQVLFIFSLLILSTVTLAQEKDSLTQQEKERREKNIQAGNPFKKYGYTPKIATLSKGKYLEWHDLDSIIIIGSVYYNRITKKVVDFVERDMTNPDAQPLDDTRGRWLSPDPLSEEAPDWTPYRFGFNNPIYFNDPTGLFEDDYQLNADGSVELLQKTDDLSDTLYASNADGSVNYDKSVTVEKANAEDGSVISGLSESRGYMANQKNQSGYKEGDGDVSFGYTNNVNDAVSVFNFLNANTNSNIEFGLMRFEQNGSDENYLVGTQHSVDDLSKAFRSMISYIGGNNNLISLFHNHDGAVGAAGANLGISNQWGADQRTRRSVHSETLKNSNMISRFFTVHEGGGNSLIELNRFGASKTGMTMTPGSVGSINKINYNDVKK